VNQASQTITYTGPTTGTVGTPGTLSATGGASGNAVTFTVDGTSGSGVCNVTGTNGTTVNFTAAGTCVIDANQAGNTNYSAAPQVQPSITVVENHLVITSTAVDGSSSSTPNLGPITVERETSSGTAITTGGALTVSLSSNSSGSPTFGTSQFGSSVTTVTIASGASTTTFWYGDTITGTPTITASATSYTSATQQETITAAPAGLSLTDITDSGGTVSCLNPSDFATTCTASVSSGGSFTAEVDFVNSVSSPVVYSTTQASTITETGHNLGSVTIAANSTTSTSTITASTSGSSTKTSTLTFGPYTVTINVTG
jgi:hypothetical protein